MKERKASIASTADETVAADAASTRSYPDIVIAGSLTKQPPRYRLGGSFSRAANYLMRRSISKKRGSELMEEQDDGEEREDTTNCADYSSDYGRIKDMFATELNRCNTYQLPQLRRDRAAENAIICYESDDDETENSPTSSSSEGTDDPIENPHHLEQSEASRNSPKKGKVTSLFASSAQQPNLADLLGMSTIRCHVARAQYLPKSAHIALPDGLLIDQQ